jgi:Pyruvate/2-oxoacid:ferredoxin oxidoreductase delta subunit
VSLSRRELLSFLRPGPRPIPVAPPPSASPAPPSRALPPTLVPVIAASACLAATSFCSVCSERCPRPGAIVLAGRVPRVVEAACDGCGRCIATCPAPTLAIGLTPRGAA